MERFRGVCTSDGLSTWKGPGVCVPVVICQNSVICVAELRNGCNSNAFSMLQDPVRGLTVVHHPCCRAQEWVEQW